MKKYLLLSLIHVFFISLSTAQLSETHTIGTGGEFITIDSAITAMETQGVSDTLVFVMHPGVFNEQIIIDGSLINYLNGVKPITFISQTSNPNDIVLKFDADTLNNYTLKIKDISLLTIDGITVQAIDTSFGRVIELDNFVDSTSINNCIIIGIDSVNIANQTTCVNIKNLNTDSTMVISFNNNDILNGKDGISKIDNNGVYNYLTLNINNNSFTNQKRNALFMNNKIASISNNYILSNYADNGINASSLDSFYISNNKIILSSSIAAGINIYGNVFISNNFISITNGNYGIWCNGYSKIFSNTILLKNTTSMSSCIENNSNTVNKIFNNCLINLDGDRIISNFTHNYTNWIIDYNNLYSPYINFNDLVNTIGGNIHSVSFMPNFVSNTDLHTNSALLYQTGIAIPEITTDIDGETRNNPPCIGADEFTNPVFNAGNDTVICYYDQYYYENPYVYDIGSGYDSYQWSTGSDSSSIVIDSLNNSIGDNTYFVTVTLGTNTYTDTINIIYDLPDAISQTDYCINYGEPLTVWAEPNLSYLWSNGDTTQFTIINYLYEQIEVTDNYGCTNKEKLEFDINYNPAHIFIDESNYYSGPFYDAPSDTVICSDEILTLVANNYFGNAGIYENTFNWSTGDTTHTLTVDSAHFGIGIHTFIVSVINKESVFNCESKDTIFVEIKNCNSVNDIYDENNISLYPNPANTYINIESNKFKIKSIDICDLKGKLIKKAKITNNSTISILGFKNGVYILKINFDDNNQIIKRLIIEH